MLENWLERDWVHPQFVEGQGPPADCIRQGVLGAWQMGRYRVISFRMQKSQRASARQHRDLDTVPPLLVQIRYRSSIVGEDLYSHSLYSHHLKPLESPKDRLEF